MQKFAEKLKNIKASFKSDESGFTLIELIVVMAILAVLVLLAAPQFLGYTKDAAATSLKQDARVAEDAAFLYHIDEGDWPTTKTVVTVPTAVADKLVHVNPENAEESYVKDLDESKLLDKKYVKGFSKKVGDAKFNDFGIVTKGPDAGSVFLIKENDEGEKEGIVDRDNVEWFSGRLSVDPNENAEDGD